jgi:phosphoadenosine phosphosulfate reductase
MARLTQADLNDLNETLEEHTPQEHLKWAVTTFGTRTAILSAMQKSGSVVCHMAYSLSLKLEVVFVDTGVMFQETLNTRDRIQREYELPVITLTPELTMEEQTRQRGILYLTKEGQEECCEIRKSAPLLAAKGRYDCLIGSLRRSEGGQRDGIPILSVDPKMNCVRINVLANFTDQELEQYITEHHVIVNPLHYQGFETIGCNRCTTPVLTTEPPRAGRWRHLGSWAMYCGINPTDVRGGTAKAIDLPQNVIDKILGLKDDFVI